MAQPIQQARPTTNQQSLTVPGFTSKVKPSNLITVASFARQRRGKTHFALTAALVPRFAPVGIIPLDKNTRDVVKKFIDENPDVEGQIFMTEKDFIKGPVADLKELIRLSRETKDKALETHRKLCDEIKALYYTLNDSPLIKTIIIDTATQLWQYIMFANYGRSLRIDPTDRGVANQEMIDLINSSKKHLILTHDASEIWVVTGKDHQGRDTKGPSGNDKLDGCPKVVGRVNVVLEHFKRKTPKTRDGGGELVFGVKVSDSTLRPDLVGDPDSELVGEDCNWMTLVSLLKPELLVED